MYNILFISISEKYLKELYTRRRLRRCSN